jgi:hypothetical protein
MEGLQDVMITAEHYFGGTFEAAISSASTAEFKTVRRGKAFVFGFRPSEAAQIVTIEKAFEPVYSFGGPLFLIWNGSGGNSFELRGTLFDGSIASIATIAVGAAVLVFLTQATPVKQASGQYRLSDGYAWKATNLTIL